MGIVAIKRKGKKKHISYRIHLYDANDHTKLS